MAVLLNLQEDFDISVDFFSDPCAQMSFSSHDGDGARIFHSLPASETSSACTLCDLSSTLEAEHEQMLTSTRSEVSHSKKHHDGEDVLEEDEVEACAMEVCADADVDVTGATTMAEAAQRMSSDKIRKVRKPRM